MVLPHATFTYAAKRHVVLADMNGGVIKAYPTRPSFIDDFCLQVFIITEQIQRQGSVLAINIV